jgi:adenosylcobinamide kinase/adenosylcobinamide-phosphate guanylyltransferase
MATTLFLGGARSGKSRHAQLVAERHDGPLVYVATAEVLDDEMADRIARHRADRGDRWRTVECPLDLAAAIAEAEGSGAVLVDCLTLWLSNLMHAGRDPAGATRDLLGALAAMRSPVLLVSNEVGLGIVPATPLGRRFRDEAGRMNQLVAEAVDEAWFVVAGRALALRAP